MRFIEIGKKKPTNEPTTTKHCDLQQETTFWLPDNLFSSLGQHSAFNFAELKWCTEKQISYLALAKQSSSSPLTFSLGSFLRKKHYFSFELEKSFLLKSFLVRETKHISSATERTEEVDFFKKSTFPLLSQLVPKYWVSNKNSLAKTLYRMKKG